MKATQLPQRASRERVLILCSTAWGIRNVVLSGLLDTLRADLDVPLLVSSAANNALSEACEVTGQVELLKVKGPRHDPLGGVLDAAFARRHRIRSYGVFSQWNSRGQGVARQLWRPILAGLAMIGSQPPVLRRLVTADQRRTRRYPGAEVVRTQLQALAPSLVVSTASVVPDEAAYVRSAEELGIPTLGCVLSFDNLTSRGHQPAFTHYAVWSDRMRGEVLRLYPDCDPSRVHVTGTPQFDLHHRTEYRCSRTETLHRLGLQPHDRYVLFAANSTRFTPSEPDLVRAFCQRLDAAPETRGHRVVVRPHPADDLSRWGGVASADPRLVLSVPQSADGRFGTAEAQAKLVSTVAHADACLNMASTMSLDAAVLDVPVVCVGFALVPDSNEDRLAAACYRTTHYEPVVASGGVRVAHSLDELIAETVAYVRSPARDRAARHRLVAEVCGPVDGGAADRIASLIRRLASPGVNQVRLSGAVMSTLSASAGAGW